MKKIAVFLANGFEEIEAISIIDVLRRASFDVTTVSINSSAQVTGSHNITILTDNIFESMEFDSFDMLVLPGGMPGAKNLNEHDGLKKLILQFNESEKYLGAICAAPMVFGQLGILKNKNATCFPGFENYLNDAKVTGASKEVAGNIVTGKGAGVAIEFALQIVEILKDKKSAEELAKRMVVK